MLFGRQPDREEMADFFEKARVQGKSGHIRVHVPRAKSEAWKKAVQASGRGK